MTIGRRPFIAIACASVAAPMAPVLRAQNKSPLIGVLLARPRLPTEAGLPFAVRLRELGWEEGRTFHFESAFGDGHADRLPGLAAALVAKKVDLIVTAGSEGARAAAQATQTIPIVAIGPDLMALGLVQSLARPGGNITGLSYEPGPSIHGKRLELLKRAAPAVKRIVYIGSNSVFRRVLTAEETVAAARALGVVISSLAADDPAGLDAAFTDVSRNRPDALWFSASALNIGHRDRIVAFAARERLPAVYAARSFADAGGLMSYGTNLVEVDRRAADYVDKILRGAKPGDLPVEQPTRFEFVINLKAASALGVTIPKELLLVADEVIR